MSSGRHTVSEPCPGPRPACPRPRPPGVRAMAPPDPDRRSLACLPAAAAGDHPARTGGVPDTDLDASPPGADPPVPSILPPTTCWPPVCDGPSPALVLSHRRRLTTCSEAWRLGAGGVRSAAGPARAWSLGAPRQPAAPHPPHYDPMPRRLLRPSPGPRPASTCFPDGLCRWVILNVGSATTSPSSTRPFIPHPALSLQACTPPLILPPNRQAERDRQESGATARPAP